MYGFIENFIAQKFVDAGIIPNFEVYAVSEGTVAIVDARCFNIAYAAIMDIARRPAPGAQHYPDHYIQVVPSDVNGMKTILHPFWTNDIIFDSITPGNVKEMPEYIAIRQLIPSRRFIFTDFAASFFNTIVRLTDNENDLNRILSEDILEATDNHTEQERQPEEAVPSPTRATEEVIGEEERTYMQIFSNYEIPILKNDSGYYVHRTSIFDEDELSEFASKIKQNVVVSFGSGSVIRSVVRAMDGNSFGKNTMIIYPTVGNPRFVPGPIMTHTLFGYDFGSLYQIHMSEKEASSTRRKGPLGPAFAEYDYVYRDFKTGVIWALQKKNEIFLMFGDISTISSKLMSTVLKELGDRFNGKLNYAEMFDRDVRYFSNSSKNDKEFFTNLAVSSVKTFMETMKQELLNAKERYSEYLDKTMEYAKTAQRLEESILCMNEEKIANEEIEKSRKIYEDVISMPKVISMKVVGSEVHVYTKNIYVQSDQTKKWHDIGTFHIVIGMYGNKYESNNTVRIYNTKHQVHAFNALMQAPHVFEDGHICHGNIIGAMVDAYKRRDIFQMITMIIIFLENANLDDSAGSYLPR